MEERLCPRCGAYWGCDCAIEDLVMPVDDGCDHDWTDAVGVEVDIGPGEYPPKVRVCRLCGLYAVGAAIPGA